MLVARIKAFTRGVWEFKRIDTSGYPDELRGSYDWGRMLAHWLTFHRFNPLRY